MIGEMAMVKYSAALPGIYIRMGFSLVQQDPVGKPFDPGFHGWLFFEETAGRGRDGLLKPFGIGLLTGV